MTYGGSAYGGFSYAGRGIGASMAAQLAAKPAAELVQLRDRLQHLDLEAEPEAAARALSSAGVPEPEGGWLRDPERRMELVAWVSLLISILSWMFPRTADVPPPPKPNRQQIAQEIERQLDERLPRDPERPPQSSSHPNNDAASAKDKPTNH